jgi:hypothetical protein
LEELSKTTVNLSQDCRSPDEVLNTERPEYEAELFSTAVPYKLAYFNLLHLFTVIIFFE